MAEFLLNISNGRLHTLPPHEECNTDAIPRRDRRHIFTGDIFKDDDSWKVRYGSTDVVLLLCEHCHPEKALDGPPAA